MPSEFLNIVNRSELMELPCLQLLNTEINQIASLKCKLHLSLSDSYFRSKYLSSKKNKIFGGDFAGNLEEILFNNYTFDKDNINQTNNLLDNYMFDKDNINKTNSKTTYFQRKKK